MAIKTFQIVQENLRSLGMDPNPSVPKFNARTLGVLFLVGVIFMSNCFFFRNEANNFGSGVFITAIDFVLFISKRDELYRFMNRFECVINESE